MRWTQLAVLFAACCATQCLAEMPDMSGSRPQAMQLFQGRMFGGQNWWSRYGEPVNATALAQAETLPADKNMSGAPMSAYGDGYIYGPGSCDCPPPCISHLWNGYFQNPKRCHTHGLFGRQGGYGDCDNGSGNCGNGGGCGPCRGMLANVFGHGCNSGCCNSCGGNDSCSCAAPVTCTTAAPDCGCKPVCGKCHACHVGHKWRCFTAHWNGGCNSCSCSTPVGCGCATATPDITIPSEKQAFKGPPKPLPEEALLHPLPRLN